MNWFKRLSLARSENQINRKTIKNVKCKKCSNISSLSGNFGCCQSADPKLVVTNLQANGKGNFLKSTDNKPTTSFTIIEPDEFFHDPEHVRQYREEAEVLEIVAEWEIIDYPWKETFQKCDLVDSDLSPYYTDEIDIDDKDVHQIESISSSNSNNNDDKDREYNYDGDIEFNYDSDNFFHKNFYYSLFDRSSKVIYDDVFHAFWGLPIHNGIAITKKIDTTIRKVRRKRKRRKRKQQKQEIFKIKTWKSTILKNEFHKKHETICKNKFIHNSISDHNFKRTNHDNSLLNDKKDVQKIFGLSDHGGILLNIDHIKEEKAHRFVRHRKKKKYRKVIRGKEIDENYVVKRSFVEYFKDFIQFFGDIISGHPRNKSQPGGPGDTVQSYTLKLANDCTSTFSRNIENFISCTKESREAAPQVVMRNMRQFMNGMKNYLVKHGEGDFQQEVLKARSRLKSDEFLNLDAILETVMHQLVVLPLREHLYGMFVDYYTRSGDIQLLVENVKYACARSPLEFGIRSSVTPPNSMALNQISSLLLKLQEAELPFDKLDLFLCVISAIFDATGCPRGQQLGADDFLPILVFVVAKCGFVGAEIEAEFMWGLLQPPLLSGEAGYYLTALCSAVHVLKSFMSSENEGTGSLDWRSSSLPACSSVLRVIIPDECNGSLQTRTLPVRPHTTTREVCRIIAHKARITNPQDYGLFKLVDGEETALADSECPQDARIAARGKHCMLAYKRIDAKIAWPTVSATFA